MLKLGEKTISKLYYGDKAISKAYLDDKLVFNKKPYYCEVEYLESTGTQYIDTGLTGNTNTKAELSVIISTQATGNVGILGSRGNSANNNLLAIGYGTSALAIDFNNSSYSSYRAAISYAPGTKYICYTSKEERFIKDENGLILAQNTTLCNDAISTGNLLLFAETGVSSRLEGKIFYAKIWDGDILVRDYIPVLDNNMRPCLYDKVSGKLFYNQGTGEFIAGPVVGNDAPKYTPLNWLQSSDLAYIDTGYALKSENCRIETSFTRTSTSSNRYIFGARSSSVFAPGLYLRSGAVSVPFGGNDTSVISTSISLNTQYEFVIDAQAGTLNVYNNGKNVIANRTTSKSIAVGYPYYLFVANHWGMPGGSYGNNVQLSYWRLYDDGVLARDIIPVLDENGVPCMYDQVEKVFHYNANTVGEFLYG